MDLAGEIAAVDRQLADAARAEQSAAELRERRAELTRAQELEAEAQERAREARAAAARVKAAEDADRATRAAPLVAALGVIGQELAELEIEAERVLWTFARSMRAVHERHAAVVARHNDVLGELRAVSPDEARAIPVRHVDTVRWFVASRWQRFNHEGIAADGRSHWVRALDAESGR